MIHFFYCVAYNWLSGPNPVPASPQLIVRFTTSWAKSVYETSARANFTFVLQVLTSEAWRPHLKIHEGQVALISNLRILDLDLTETMNDLEVLPYLVEAEKGCD